MSPPKFFSTDPTGGALLRLIRTLLIAALLPAPAHHAQQNLTAPAQEFEPLELGKAITHELAGGQEHTYQISVSKDQYAGLIVEQRGVDVVVQLVGADGKAIADFDYEITNQGEEKIELVSESPGVYRLIVKAKYPRLPTGRYVIRFAEMRPAIERDRWLYEARKLEAASRRLWGAAKYSDALSPGERALELQERVWGPAHPELSYPLLNLAAIKYYKGDYANAVTLCRRALMIAEKALGPEHPLVGRLSFNLAVFYTAEAEDIAPTEELHQRALSIQEKVLGPDHPLVASSLAELAILYRKRGDLTRAEQLLQRALTVHEKVFGEEHELVATSLNYLASVYREKGDYAKAEPLYKRSLAIREKTNHPYLAVALNNLANLYNDMGDFERAEPLYRRSLAIREKAVGLNHPQVANTQGALALLYFRRGDYAKAEPLYLSALGTMEKTVGPNSQLVGELLVGMADLYVATNDYAKAEPLYERALTIYERAYGTTNPYLASILVDLARLSAAKDQLGSAVALQARANAIIEHNLDLNLTAGSERQKLAYLLTLPEQMHQSISLHVSSAVDDAKARDLAATTILQRKGRILDAMSASFASLRLRSSAEAQTLISQYNETTAQLARLILNGPGKLSIEEHQKKVAVLEERRESLEADISRHSGEFRANSTPVTRAAVQAAIPDNSALVEFVVYHPFDPKAESKREIHKEPHYVAYVFRHNADVRWRDLGEAKAIDQEVGALRQALRDPSRPDIRERSRAVDEKVMQPVRELIGGAEQLLISPDGALNLIPFEALVDEQNRYLVQRYSFTYLTSGRDLLRLQAERNSQGAPLVFVDPLFGEPEMAEIAKITPKKGPQRATTGSDLSSVYFTPLSGTALEGQVIQSLFSDAALLTGAQATESRLKQAAAPRMLHIATHGFFLDDLSSPPSGADRRSISVNVKVENPLLRSGLALASANLKKGGNDDGILTGLEASGLNLWGTKLVVLSACDTGVGEVKNGEGVYGLRRAFVLAGTETLVMSLWPVSDYATRELMAAYYGNLKRGIGRGQALRQVQLSMLKRKERQHPFYWASFIQSGEWANLDGKR